MLDSNAGPENNDFVYRTLADRSNWTEDIVAGLMSRAHVTPNPSLDHCRKMAIKFLWLLKCSRSGWIPTRSCVDLTTTGAALTPEEELLSVEEVREMWSPDGTRRAKRQRHFKTCVGCGRRFLAKHGNMIACSRRCRNRAHRLRHGLPVRYRPGACNAQNGLSSS